MIVRTLIALALGLVTTYAVAVVPPNFLGAPAPGSIDFRSSGPEQWVTDGYVPTLQRSRWKDIYSKGFYADPARGLVALVPPLSTCHQMLRCQHYQDRPIGGCGTGAPQCRMVEIEEWGWPMRCTWSWWSHERTAGYSEGKCFASPIPSKRPLLWDPPDLKLPYGIVWSGLAVNTAAFASPWMALFMVPGAVRTLRRRKGQCGRCGYSRHGLAVDSVCPECGASHVSASAPSAPR